MIEKVYGDIIQVQVQSGHKILGQKMTLIKRKPIRLKGGRH